MKNSFVLVILLIALGVIPLFDLIHGGLPITHDGQDHVARIANFYQNLQDGNIIPRWAGNLNWGYGHPILMFLYPLPSYVASFFHFIGLSFVDATKAVFTIAFILSGLSMFIWINSFLNEKAAFVAGILYMFAPYRFVDLYVRGAIGEHVAFIFPPLVLYFLYKLSREIKWVYMAGGAFSLAGFILSHNAIMLMFLPILLAYVVYLSSYIKKKNTFIISTFFTSILGFGLAAFFWLPAFFEGKYTLRDIVTKGEFKERFVDVADFMYGPWNYGGTGEFTVQIGMLHWIVVAVGIFLAASIFKKNRKLSLLLISFLLMFLGSLFLMLQYSEFFWYHITTLQKFQFPWRFLSVSVFTASAIGGLCIYLLPKKLHTVLLFVFIGSVLWFNKEYWHAKGFLQKEESFYTSVYNGTTDTGESAPIWSVRFMLERPRVSLEAVEGTARIRQIERTTTKHQYEIVTQGRTRIKENTLYFPGWTVYDNGKKVSLEFQDPSHRGLMTFYVEEGKHSIVAIFNDTKLRSFANLISGVSLCAIIFFSFWNKLWKRFL